MGAIFGQNARFTTLPVTPLASGLYPGKAQNTSKTLILGLPAAFGPRDPSKTRILGLIVVRNPLKTCILGSRALQNTYGEFFF